jgi:hypothetical protein
LALVALVVSGRVLVDTKVGIVHFLLLHQLAVVAVFMVAVMVLETQKMAVVVVVVGTQLLVELEQQIRDLGEETALLLHPAILVAVEVVHLPLVVMVREIMAVEEERVPTRQ